MKCQFTILLLLGSLFTQAQVGVNTNNPKATLDIVSKTPDNPLSTDGLLVPRVSVNPTSGNDVGQLLFNTSDNKFYYWNGSAWTTFANQSISSSSSISVDTHSSTAITLSNTDTTEKLIPGLSKAITLSNKSVVNFISSINFKSTSSVFQPKFSLKLTNTATGVNKVINNVSESYMSDGTVITTGNLLLVSTQTLEAGSYTVEVFASYENCCPYVFSYTTGGEVNKSSLIINIY